MLMNKVTHLKGGDGEEVVDFEKYTYNPKELGTKLI